MSNREVGFDWVVVVLPRKRLKLLDALHDKLSDVGFYRMSGRGTANNKLLEALGLEVEPMVLTFTCVRHEDCPTYLAILREELALQNPGHGIALALPMERSLGLLTLFGVADERAATTPKLPERLLKLGKFGKKKKAEPDALPTLPPHIVPYSIELIVAILSENHATEAIRQARSLGVRGGTIVPAQGRGEHGGRTFLGMELVPEKEILLMAVEQARALPILEALYTQGELALPGSGIAFSIPVYLYAGLASSLRMAAPPVGELTVEPVVEPVAESAATDPGKLGEEGEQE